MYIRNTLFNWQLDKFIYSWSSLNCLMLELPQVGDVVVVDISAATIGQDGANGQDIPSAETKGFASKTWPFSQRKYYFYVQSWNFLLIYS